MIYVINWSTPCSYIQKIRKKVRNKARVEGSIVEAYLVEEATNFLPNFLYVPTWSRPINYIYHYARKIK